MICNCDRCTSEISNQNLPIREDLRQAREMAKEMLESSIKELETVAAETHRQVAYLADRVRKKAAKLEFYDAEIRRLEGKA